jgi:cytochrome c5
MERKTMIRIRPIAMTVLLTGLSVLYPLPAHQASAAQSDPAVKQTAKPPVPAKAPSNHELDGDVVFQQHCSRCHNAPEGFSPRISGTIVRHMRIRASLSEREEQALLRFFNP